MIFPGHLELADINQYRHCALTRKQRRLGEAFTGVGQLEFELLECFERLYEKDPELPYVNVLEYGDGKVQPGQEEPRIYCKLSADGRFLIYLDCREIRRLYQYTNLMFGPAWPDWKIALEAKQGNRYTPYAVPLYDYPAFRQFDSCRRNLERYITKMATWFIGLHEFAHIKNGHLQLKQAIKAKKVSVDISTLRALEVHADITAAADLLSIIDSWQKYIGKRQYINQANGKNPGITYCDELTFAVMAAYLSQRCFLKRDIWDEWTVGMHEGSRETHPLTALRMAIVMNVFLQGAIDLGQTPEERMAFAGSVYRAVQQFEEFYFQNKGNGKEEDKIYYRPTELLRTEKGKAYYHEIFDAVMGLNELLKPYAEHPSLVQGQWIDYETLPERMCWTE